MADSAFWRDLAGQFLALQHDARLHAGGANDLYGAVEALVKRGGSKIPGAGGRDPLGVWLEELRKEGLLAFQSSRHSNGVLTANDYAQKIVTGSIAGMCQASATLCRIFGDRAAHAELEEKQRTVARTLLGLIAPR
jgi:hypothetical protein